MTFKNLGVPALKTALVESSDGTQMVAHHNNEMWIEGHHNPEGPTIQTEQEPVKVISLPSR